MIIFNNGLFLISKDMRANKKCPICQKSVKKV